MSQCASGDLGEVEKVRGIGILLRDIAGPSALILPRPPGFTGIRALSRFWQLSIWISRAALAYAILDFGVPAFAALAEPVTVMHAAGITMWTGSAVTTTRVYLGIYPLAIMLIAIYCLLSPPRLLGGLGLITLVKILSLIGFGAGIFLEGANGRNLLLIEREAATMLIYTIALAIEWRRRTSAFVASTPMREFQP